MKHLLSDDPSFVNIPPILYVPGPGISGPLIHGLSLINTRLYASRDTPKEYPLFLKVFELPGEMKLLCLS